MIGQQGNKRAQRKNIRHPSIANTTYQIRKMICRAAQKSEDEASDNIIASGSIHGKSMN